MNHRKPRKPHAAVRVPLISVACSSSSNRTGPIKVYGSPSIVTEEHSVYLGSSVVRQGQYATLLKWVYSFLNPGNNPTGSPAPDAPMQAPALPSFQVSPGTASGTMTGSDSQSERPLSISAFDFIGQGSSRGTPRNARLGLSNYPTGLSEHAVCLYADESEELLPLNGSSVPGFPLLLQGRHSQSPSLPAMTDGVFITALARSSLILRTVPLAQDSDWLQVPMSTRFPYNDHSLKEDSAYRGEREMSPGWYVSTN